MMSMQSIHMQGSQAGLGSIHMQGSQSGVGGQSGAGGKPSGGLSRQESGASVQSPLQTPRGGTAGSTIGFMFWNFGLLGEKPLSHNR